MQSVVRYVLFDFLLVFIIALVVAAGLMLFVGAMLDLPQDIGAAEILLMLPYLVPEAFRNAMQAAALFAACSVFGRLAGSNELLALSSLGISPFKVIRPVLLVATLLSLTCVWLYDIGESWGQKGIQQVVVDSAEAIAYRFLRTKRSYSKEHVALNVKGVEGRKLIRPTLIMETPDQPEPVTVSAEEGELRTIGRERGLSIVMRRGTVYIGDVASMAFPDSMEQVISLSEGRRSRWPPTHRSLANLQEDLADQRAAIARMERAPRLSPADWMAATVPQALAASTSELETERQHLHWIEAQINRRWTNGFFCLAYVAIGIPVAMRVRSRDYLTSFFACFVPVVVLNHPLHNFCIKLAEAGRAPAVLPWAGDLLLVLVGAVLLNRSLRHQHLRFQETHMIVLDINSNYSDSGGGIRTYHRAKIAWFNRQREHRYYLIVPGAKHSVRRIGRRSVRIEVFGLPLGGGYRLLLGFWRVLLILRRLRPQVVEAGDPFLTGIFCLSLGRLRFGRHRLAAFYHSDPIETWVVPWARRGWKHGWRNWLAQLAGGVFYRLQRRYDVTVVTSLAMEQHLRARGVGRLVRKPFGSDPVFFAPPRSPVEGSPVKGSLVKGSPVESSPLKSDVATPTNNVREVRLLFIGRLGADKAADLLWQALPQIMSLPGVRLTIVGKGPLAQAFAEAKYDGLQYLGYVSERRQVAEIYSQHDVLLAPGPYETFGLAVLEAMASGLVVVGPDRGGTAELLDEAQSPFVFRSGDQVDFLRVIRAAMAADFGTHSAAAQAAARRYGTWHQAIGRMVTYYEQSAGGAPRSLEPDRYWRLDKPRRHAAGRSTQTILGRSRD